MKDLVTGTTMQQIDNKTIHEIGIPSLVLMERAAFSVLEEIKKELQKQDHILVCCGTGNNGADGVALARMLWLEKKNVIVIVSGDSNKGSKEFNIQLQIAKNLNMPIMEQDDFIPGDCDVIIDALFGVGLNRPISGSYREFVKMLNSLQCRLRIAVDIPSGVFADSGEISVTENGEIVVMPADLTVTFGYEKVGTAVYPGKNYCGKVITKDIGFPDLHMLGKKTEYNAYEKTDLPVLLPRRAAYSNKGSFGKVLIIAGSKNMCGAAYLSALAAYRCGAGLVRVMTVKENRDILLQKLPEAVMDLFDPDQIMEEEEAWQQQIENACRSASVIVFGPGIGREAYVEKLAEDVLTRAYAPVIIDADGLNVIAENTYLTSYYTENIIITPHLGEMSRLTGKSIETIRHQVVKTAVDYSEEYGVTCVLKDAATVIASKDLPTFINQSGCSAMAKAGAGDVLTGVIAGLIAMGMEEASAASLGVYLHGLAGEAAAAVKGKHGVLAEEIAEALPAVMNENKLEEKRL